MGILSKLEKGSEIYAENTALRALITAIPHVGGSLDIIFASKASKLIEERLLYLIARLRLEMKSIREQVVDKDFIESEDFYDLIMRTMDASSKTRHKEKIDTYATLLKNSVISQDREEYSAEDYLNILIELTPREVDVARIIYEKEEEILAEQSAQKTIDLENFHGIANLCLKKTLALLLLDLCG